MSSPFDELKPGQRVSFESSFGTAEIDRFAALSGDWNPLHMDDAHAAQTPFHQRIVHGMLVASLLSRIAGMHFLDTHSLLLGVDQVRFHNPVFVDEPLRCEAELVEIHEVFHLLTVDAKIFGRDSKLKLSARLKMQYRADASA
jgi:acyl dehydratase